MTLSLSLCRTFLPIALLAAACTALVAPTSASAILAGAESNGELANSDRTPALQAAALDKMQAQGVRVVRVNFAWNEIATGASCPTRTPAELADPASSCYNWTLLDSLVTLTKARNQQLLISLTRVPRWVSNAADPYFMGNTQAQFEKITANYATFMSAAGTRYNDSSAIGTIPYWTIWNEPGSDTFWKPTPNAQRYAYFYAQAAVALRAVNPTAKIAPGPTGPASTIKPQVFIPAFLKWVPRYLPGGSVAAKRRYINAWAHNPYPGVTSQPSVAARVPRPGVIGMASIDKLFKALDKSPLTRGIHVWGTEFGWETPPEQAAAVSPALQAQFLAEAFDWLDSKKRVDIGIWYGLTDPKAPGDFQTGTFTAAGVPKLSHRMYQRMISVPQGGISGKVKRGTVVRIWGRSSVSPSTGKLVYRTPGKKCNPSRPVAQWCLVARQTRARSSDGVITAAMVLTNPSTEFAIYDTMVTRPGDDGYGPSRLIRTF